MVQPMEPEEEERLLEEHERLRTVMLESILSVPLGRTMFIEPLESYSAGTRPARSLLDSGYWNMDRDVLPGARRQELTGLLGRLEGPYLDRRVVRELHLLWHEVEDLGKELFSRLEQYRELIESKNALLSMVGDGADGLDMLAIDLDDPNIDAGDRLRTAWLLQPRLRSLTNLLDLVELDTGTGLLRFSDSSKRFRDALGKTCDLVERFVEANLGLVISMVKRFNPCDVMEEMDLVQEGCQGLMEAVRRFDPARGCKLSTFAVWWIRQRIMKYIIRHGRLVRLPVRVQTEDSMIRRAMREFSTEYGREPELEELASYLGRDREELERIYLSTAPPLSLDHTDAESDTPIVDFLQGRLKPPDTLALDRDLRTRIETALGSLSDREKTIVTLRFGLMDGEPCTLEQLGRVMGISRERVRQIESRALDKLRKHGLLSELEASSG